VIASNAGRSGPQDFIDQTEQPNMIKIGVIGYGYWGPNLVRNFAETPGAAVAAVADVSPKQLELVQRRYPGVTTTTDYHDLLRDPAIDAIAIATPVSTHFELGMAALRAGKHLWLEKPMTETSEQARRLIDEAERRKLVLIVDHTFVYTGAVRKMKELIQSGELGRVFYYDSIRVNLGLFQRDVSVISDLAVHDFSILDYLLGEHPVAVSAPITSPARRRTLRTSPSSTTRARSRMPT
jgi:predicted dehydrogenase